MRSLKSLIMMNLKFRYQVNVVLKKEPCWNWFSSQQGAVNVPCDLTSEDFDLPIEGEMKLIVRFGDDVYNSDNEELLILPLGNLK
jgi:hypothetical protein